MKRSIAVLFCLLATNLFSQTGYGILNYNGYGADTAQVASFKADSLKYTKAFNLSQYDNLRLRVCFNDTASAGYASDSVKFYYFVQLGSPCINYLGKVDIAWNNNPLIVDTVDMLTSGNMARQYSTLINDGTFNEVMKVIDTSSVSGYATQAHSIATPWDVYFRVGIKGLTGNKVGSFLRLRVDALRREGVPVKVK